MSETFSKKRKSLDYKRKISINTKTSSFLLTDGSIMRNGIKVTETSAKGTNSLSHKGISISKVDDCAELPNFLKINMQNEKNYHPTTHVRSEAE